METRDFLLVLVAALFIFLSFPFYNLGFLAYFAIIPLIIVFKGKQLKAAFLLGYIYGLVSSGLLLWWVGYATLPGSIGMVVLLAVYPAFFGMIFSFVYKKLGSLAVYLVPFIWVAMEYIRSIGQWGFPWINVSYSQTYYLTLIQFASILGSFGISMWVVFINIFIYKFLTSKSAKQYVAFGLVIALLFSAPYVYGKMILGEENIIKGNRIKVAILQGDIDPYKKWESGFEKENFQIYSKLIKKAVTRREDLDLIIMPETATACHLQYETTLLRKFRELVDSIDVPLLTGTPHYKRDSGETKYFNAATILKPGDDDSLKFYYKQTLVPFSEHIPYDNKVKLLKKIDLGEADFTPGNESTIFHTLKGDFGVLICFESNFGRLVNDFIDKGAQFMTIITNDGWFRDSAGPYQHAQITVLRAIENRISIARAANTGISMIVDPFGRTQVRSTLDEKSVLCGEVTMNQTETFYHRNGNLPAYLSIIVLPLIILGGILKD